MFFVSILKASALSQIWRGQFPVPCVSSVDLSFALKNHQWRLPLCLSGRFVTKLDVYSACVLHFFHDVLSLLEGAQCSTSPPQRPRGPITPAVSPSPARYCFLGTSFGQFLSFFVPVCLRRKGPLSWTSSVKVLNSFEQAHFFWDFSVRGVSANVLVPGRPFVQVLTCDVPPKQPQFTEKKGPLQVRACKRWFCLRLSPLVSSHSQAQADRFTKHLPRTACFVSSPCDISIAWWDTSSFCHSSDLVLT